VGEFRQKMGVPLFSNPGISGSGPQDTSIFLTFLNWAIIAYTQNHELGVFLYGMKYQSRPQTSGKYE
jgi:hypothetical protein